MEYFALIVLFMCYSDSHVGNLKNREMEDATWQQRVKLRNVKPGPYLRVYDEDSEY